MYIDIGKATIAAKILQKLYKLCLNSFFAISSHFRPYFSPKADFLFLMRSSSSIHSNGILEKSSGFASAALNIKLSFDANKVSNSNIDLSFVMGIQIKVNTAAANEATAARKNSPCMSIVLTRAGNA